MISKLPIIATIILRVVTGCGSQIPGGDQIPGNFANTFSSSPGSSNPIYGTPLAPSGDFIVLLFSIIILLISLFLFYEAIKTQKRFINEDTTVTEILCNAIPWLIVFAWIFRTSLIMVPSLEITDIVNDIIFFNPRTYAPGFLLASLIPSSIGFLKLLTLIAIPQIETPRNLVMLIVKIISTLIMVAASIVTLMPYFHP